MGGSKRQVIGYKYYVGAHLILGHGPFDRILRISVGDKIAWTAVKDSDGRGNPNGYERININAPDLFGGKRSEGGIQGDVDLGMGYPSQPVNDYLRSRLSSAGNVPAYRDLVSVILRQVYVGMSPYLKNWTFRAQRIWAPIEGKQQWLPMVAGIGEKSIRFENMSGRTEYAVWINNQLWHFGWSRYNIAPPPPDGDLYAPGTFDWHAWYRVIDYTQGTDSGWRNIRSVGARPIYNGYKLVGNKVMWPLGRTKGDKFCVVEFDTATPGLEHFEYAGSIDMPSWGGSARGDLYSDMVSAHWWEPLGVANPILTLIGPPGFGYTFRPYERDATKLPELGVADWTWGHNGFFLYASDTFIEPVFNQHIAVALLSKAVIVNNRYVNRYALHWINLDTGLPGNSQDLVPLWPENFDVMSYRGWFKFAIKTMWPYVIVCVPDDFTLLSSAQSRFWVINIEQLQVLPSIVETNLGLPKVRVPFYRAGTSDIRFTHSAIAFISEDPTGKFQCPNLSDTNPGYVMTRGSGKYDLPTVVFHANTLSGMKVWDYDKGAAVAPWCWSQQYGGSRPWFARPMTAVYGQAYSHGDFALREGVPVIATERFSYVHGDPAKITQGATTVSTDFRFMTVDELAKGKVPNDPNDPGGASGWNADNAVYFYEAGGTGIMRLRAISGGNWDMNPAHIIRECMTNRTWGRGLPESLIGPTFNQVAGQLYEEGLGMSLLWTSEIAVDEFIAEILRTIDAIRYENPVTGQQEIKLIRGGYDSEYYASLPVIGPDNSTSEQVVKPPVYELINQVTVTYWNRATGEDGCVTVQDTAAINQVGSVNAQAMQYVGITRGDNALAVATRDLGSLSKPFAKGKLTTNRRVADIGPGDLFILNDPASGIEQMICRVGRRIDNGALDGRVGYEWGQDVFGVAYTVVATPPDSGWVDPVPAPVNFTFSGAFEVPYPLVVQDVGDAAASRLPDDIAYLGFAGARPNSGVLLDYELWDYADGDENIGSSTVAVFTPSMANSSTMSGLGPYTVGMPEIEVYQSATNSADMDQVQAGDMAAVWRPGTGVVEWIEAVTLPVYNEALNHYTITIRRAVAGSMPVAWQMTDRIFWVGSIYGASRDEWTDGMSVSAFGRPKNSKGSYQGTPTIHTVHMAGWAGRPYAAANVRVNEYYVAPDDGQLEVEITWARRNRLSQSHNGVSWFDPTDYPPEEGTRYVLTIQGRDAAGDALGDPVVRDLGNVTRYKLDRSADVPANAKSVHLSLVTERNGLAAVLSSSFDVKLRAVLTAPFRVFSRYNSEYVPPVTKLMPYDIQADVFWEKLGLAKPTDFIADYVPTVIAAPVDLVADYDDHLDAPTRVSIAYSTKLDAPSRVFAVYSAGPKPLSAPVELVADFIPSVIAAPVELVADFIPTIIAAPVDLVADYDASLDAPSHVSIRYSTLLDAPTNVKVVYVSVKALDAPVDVIADFEPTVIHQPGDLVADYDTALDAPTRVSVAYNTTLDAPSRVMITYKSSGPALAAPIDLQADYIPTVISKVTDVVADFEPTVIYRPTDVMTDYDGSLDAPFRLGVTYSTKLDAPSHVKARYAAALASPVDVIADFEPTVIHQPGDLVADYDQAMDAPVLRGVTYRTALDAPTSIRIQYK